MISKTANRLKLKLYFLMVSFSIISVNTYAQTEIITTPRGENLQIISHYPQGKEPFPTLILAPGAGYHMQLPLMEEIDRLLVSRGIAVIRFNWAYFQSTTRKATPSPDLHLELEDFLAVLNHTKQDIRSNKHALFIGGKSLGTGVAWKLFQHQPDLKALILLTPVCSKTINGKAESEAEQNYPRIHTETRPILFISGDQDPVCESHVLLQFMVHQKIKFNVSIIGGDHGFENPALQIDDATQFKKRNITLAGLLVEEFIQRVNKK